MFTAIEIDKKALIARLNELRQRPIVDTEYETANGVTRLVLVFENGHREVFKGLRAA